MPAGSPKISVIIATYNWSSVLRSAIESVLLQTFQDFELLVVGDGCTDDSELVVRSFGDPRVRWIDLPSNSGSQATPNNRGIESSAGEYIAYLGHDDIWYPTHLESLLELAARTGADLVGAASILYGPPDSGVRAMTGVLEGKAFGGSDFMVPSSIMHTRALIQKIGPWKQPEDIALPPDCEFERRALEAGATIECSGQLTVFKFNAAWRRKAYWAKRDDEQRAMLEKIRGGRDFRQAELLEVMRSVLEGRYITIKVPDTRTLANGEIVRKSARYKGVGRVNLEEPLPTLEGTTKFDLADQLEGFEWYELERNADSSFRWTGPALLATMEIPIFCTGDVFLRVSAPAHFQEDLSTDVRLLVNGEPVAHTVAQPGSGRAILEASVPARVSQLQATARPLSVSFCVTKTRRPADLGLSDDNRWLGMAVSWVELTPAAGGD